MKNAHLPAMPIELTVSGHTAFTSLTKREMFAMAAMQGILARTGSTDRNVNARLAVEYADALLKELDK